MAHLHRGLGYADPSHVCSMGRMDVVGTTEVQEQGRSEAQRVTDRFPRCD